MKRFVALLAAAATMASYACGLRAGAFHAGIDRAFHAGIDRALFWRR